MFSVEISVKAQEEAVPAKTREIRNAARDLRRSSRELRADSERLKLRSFAVNKAADALAVRVLELSLTLDRNAASTIQ